MDHTFIAEQVVTFAVTIGLGLLIGFGYDLLRAARRFIRFSRLTQFFADFFFWLCMTLLVFAVLLLSNWGEVRAYVFLGLGLGGTVYWLLFSKPCLRAVIRIIEGFIAVVRFIACPFIRIGCLLYRICRRLSRKFGLASRKIKEKFHRQKKE